MAQRLRDLVLSYASRDTLQTHYNDRSGTKAARSLALTPPSTSIDALPSELYDKIIKYLGWRDILNVSLICRRWHKATQSRQLWVALITHIEASPGMGQLEEPVGDYTTPELRLWALKRLRMQELWDTKDSKLAFNIRKVKLDTRQQHMIVLPGGRWGLVTDHVGRLPAYDLNSTEPKPRVVIEEQLDDGYSLEYFSYWINPSKRKLSFRLAFWDPFPEIESTATCIYDINLSGHGEDSFLEATPVIVLQDELQDERSALVLTGKYLVEHRGDSLSPDPRDTLVLMKYMDGENTFVEKNRIQMHLNDPVSVNDLFITPSEQIILFSNSIVQIYTIRQMLERGEAVLSPIYCIQCACYTSWVMGFPNCYPDYTDIFVLNHDLEVCVARIFPGEDKPVMDKCIGYFDPYTFDNTFDDNDNGDDGDDDDGDGDDDDGDGDDDDDGNDTDNDNDNNDNNEDEDEDNDADDDSFMAFFGPTTAFIVHSNWHTQTVSYLCKPGMKSFVVFSKDTPRLQSSRLGIFFPSYGCIEKGVGRIVIIDQILHFFLILDTVPAAHSDVTPAA